jgi:hypothetical protein
LVIGNVPLRFETGVFGLHAILVGDPSQPIVFILLDQNAPQQEVDHFRFLAL